MGTSYSREKKGELLIGLKSRPRHYLIEILLLLFVRDSLENMCNLFIKVPLKF